MPRSPVYPSSAGMAEMLNFRSGLDSRIRLMCASESIIMPTRPLVNSSTLSCSFMVNEPGAMTPSSHRPWMYSVGAGDVLVVGQRRAGRRRASSRPTPRPRT